jgi:hypothetical protein
MANPSLIQNNNSSTLKNYTATAKGGFVVPTNYHNVNITGTQTGVLTISSGAYITSNYSTVPGAQGAYIVKATASILDYGIFSLSNTTQLGNNTTTGAMAHVTVESGATLDINSFAQSTFGLIQFGPTTSVGGKQTGGLIDLPAGQATSILADIGNIQNGDTILFSSVIATTFQETNVGQPNQSFTLGNMSGGVFVPIGTTNFQPNLTGSGASSIEILPEDVNGVQVGTYVVFVCFLPGTQIRTSFGETAVEDIRIGDQVVAFQPGTGENELREVTWIGKQTAFVRVGAPVDLAGYPVRIVKDAVAEGVPARDLLVTAEHCLFFDGKFIPARMLVNNRTIFYDRSYTSYDYFHVETDQHAVIYADNMPAESYLDTGNRGAFLQPGQIVRFPTPAKSWDDDAAAPLATDEASVKPIWERLADRSTGISLGDDRGTMSETTNDPDLRIVVSGRTIRPVRMDANCASFLLPRGAHGIELVSRTVRPAAIRPWVNDRRQLGVAVAGIRLRAGSEWRDISVDDPSLGEGWWDVERADQELWRWTSGSAHLELGVRFGVSVLDVYLQAVPDYPMQPAEEAFTPLLAVGE